MVTSLKEATGISIISVAKPDNLVIETKRMTGTPQKWPLSHPPAQMVSAGSRRQKGGEGVTRYAGRKDETGNTGTF